MYSGVIYQGGTWVVTGGVGVYTPPTGILLPIDSTTDIGGVQTACADMLDVFDATPSTISTTTVLLGRTMFARRPSKVFHWQIINSARVALNATRTHARRQKFCEESASWPDGTNGDARQYVDAFVTVATSNPADEGLELGGPRERTRICGPQYGGCYCPFHERHQYRERPKQREKLIGRDWLNDIP